MPHIKNEKVKVPFFEIRKVLLGYEVNAPLISSVIHCSEKTARKKLRNPEFFTLADIALLSRFCHIPIEEFRDGIKLN